MSRFSSLLACVLLALAASATLLASPAAAADATIADYISQNAQFSVLSAKLATANLLPLLNSTASQYTLLAFTDDAFFNLTLDEQAAFNSSGNASLLYHVVAGAVSAESLAALGLNPTQSNNSFIVNKVGAQFTANGNVLSPRDIALTNGLVHVLGGKPLLIPNKYIIQSVQNSTVLGQQVGTLNSLLTLLPDVQTRYNSSGPYTLFAPTDAAVAALNSFYVKFLVSNPSSLLDDLLLFHGVSGAWFANDLAAALPDTTTVFGLVSLTEQALPINVQKSADGSIIINGLVKIIATDATQINGVIHIVDTVIQFTPSQVLASLSGFTTLISFLGSAGLTKTFDTAASSTIFAPNDAAFAKLTSRQVAFLQQPENLAAVLGLHLVNQSVWYADLSVGPRNLFSTSSSQHPSYIIHTEFYPWADPYNVTVMGGVIIPSLADISTSLGTIVHVLDRPIAQIPTLSVGATAKAPPASYPVAGVTFTKFMTALALVPSLNDSVFGDPSVTVFAPTDAAFAAIPPNVLNYLLANTDLLTFVLNYHVVYTTYYTSVAPVAQPGAVFSTYLNGEVIYFSKDSSGVFSINNKTALVTIPDFPASNGVLHAVDQVLIPISVSLFNKLPLSGFTKFAFLAHSSSVAPILQSTTDSYTVVAPTDAAFDADTTGLFDLLVSNSTLRDSFLKYFILSGEFNASSLLQTTYASNLLSNTLRFDVYNSSSYFLGQRLSGNTLAASNGLIVQLDTVFLPPQDSLATIASIGELSIFSSLLPGTTLGSLLADPTQNFTIFAPSDAALTTFINSNPAVTTSYIATLFKRIVLHHVLNTVIYRDGLLLENMKTLQTAAGDEIQISTDMQNDILIYPGGSVVVGTNHLASNGVIHVISQVLIPDLNTFEILQLNGFTQIVNVVNLAGLSDSLANYSTACFFAVTDAVFNASSYATRLTTDAAFASSHIKNNLIGYPINGSYVNDATFLNQAGNYVYSSGSDAQGAYINGAKILDHYYSQNKWVYTMDSLAVYQPDLYTAIKTRNDTTLFVKALDSTGYNRTLVTSNSLSVFVPNDNALSQIPQVIFDQYQDVLAKVIAFHIINNNAIFSRVFDLKLRPFTTFAGQNATLLKRGDEYFLNSSKVVVADLLAPAGVAQMLEYFNVPLLNALDRIKFLSYTALVSKLQSAALDAAVANANNITLFGFDDFAYNNLTPDQQAKLNDPEVLKYHVAAKIATTDFADSGLVKTLSAASIRTNIYNGRAYVDGKAILTANDVTTNGFLSTVSAPLTPPTSTVYQLISANPQLSTLKAKIDLAGLAATLNSTTQAFTLFAPVNAAFTNLGDDSRLNDKSFVSTLLLGHALGRTMFLAGFDPSSVAVTLAGRVVIIGLAGGVYSFDKAKLLSNSSNTLATNGVLHVIDTVIIDPQPQPDNGGSNGGAIAAGIIVPLVVIGGAVGYWYWRRRKARYQYTPLI